MRLKRILELPEWDLSGYAIDRRPDQRVLHHRHGDAGEASERPGGRLPDPAGRRLRDHRAGVGYAYTNQDGYDEDVAIYGGTVTVITLTRAGGSAAQVGTTGPINLRLAPGDAVTLTYSVAPTMRKTPVS
jgi:hypothetical protein